MEFLRKIIKPILILFVLYVIFFMTLANFILSVIFKNDWSGVKDLIPLLTVPVGINFFWNPFINFLYAECRWDRILKINAIRIIVVASSSFVCISTDQNWKVSVMAMFVSGAVVQITCMAVSFKNISNLFRA
jgi:O-antigen/teichoic acid export membrane protein